MRADRGLAVAVMLAAAITFAGCSPGSMQADIPYIRLKAASAADGGIKAFAEGDYGRALDRFKEALRIERAIDDRPGEVRALINLGRVFTALGHLESAELYLNDGVTLAGTLKGEERLSAEALSTLAKVEYLRGRQQASLDDIEKALSLDSRLGIASGERLNLKGVIYARAGRLGEAKEALNSALLLNIREKDAVEAANSYRTMAEIKEAEADLPGAMEFYLKAYELDSVNALSGKTALDLDRMAGIHMAGGRPHEAVFLLERSYIVNMNAGARGKAVESLDKLINAYGAMGNKEKAMFYTKIKEAGINGSATGEDR